MEKRIIQFRILALLFVLIGFNSCKKKDFHKVRFEIKMLDVGPKGYPNEIIITASPNYILDKKKNFWHDKGSPNTAEMDPNEVPHLNNPMPGSTWTYDYYGLEKKERIYFNVLGRIGYYFEMRVYIDDVETSYMKIKVLDYKYYTYIILEASGLNNDNTGTPTIDFKY